MKRETLIGLVRELWLPNRAVLLTCVLLTAFSGGAHGIGEKVISLGGAAAWNGAKYREGVTEIAGVRSHPVLVLSSAFNSAAKSGGSPDSAGPSPDLAISFDESSAAYFRDSTGRYRVFASPALEAVDRRFSRLGTGAALFPGMSNSGTAVRNAALRNNVTIRGSTSAIPDGPLVIVAQSGNALFSPGSHIRDFTIEFWLYPLNMENGEQILSWIASRPMPPAAPGGEARYALQRIQCSAAKSRLLWTFMDFFVSPDAAINSDNAPQINLTIAGSSPVVPKNWSHHLIRFDSNTGMLEYLVNGKTEAIEYASSTGREGGEVYTPITGDGGSFVLGGHFMGIMDEFKIHDAWAGKPQVQKYPVQGGRMETGAIDLGEGNSGVIKVDAFGGRTTIAGTKISGEFRENGRFRFADDSELQFFIRTADHPYRWDASDWRSFTPGADLSGTVPAGNIHGRYVQLAVDFYPSADGESSPYLEELRITYIPDEPPLPPASLAAVAVDGGVRLRWKNSPDTDTAGYLVYYGTARDEYFSEDARQGASPVDAGKQNSVLIEGLKNGTLYYFRIAAYDRQNDGVFHAGEFSREVTARPLKGLAAHLRE